MRGAAWMAGWAVAMAAVGCAPAGDDASSVSPAAGAGDGEVVTMASETTRARARELAKQLLITDTHIDVPYRIQAQKERGADVHDISQRTAGGDFDYPRAREGGLDLPFMSIYIPASHQEEGGAKELADELIDMVEGWVEAHPDKFALVRERDQARAAHRDGKVGLALGIENGAPIENDLANLKHFHDRGVRYVTLTHSRNNQICDSSYDEDRTWNGLSPFGREVVAEMNRLGMMIDVSHVSDEAFFQVVELTKAPVVATHSSARRFTPDWERNMSDDMIRALAKNGGVIHINFGSSFISEEYRQAESKGRVEVREHFDANGIDSGSEEGRAYIAQYRKDHPVAYATLGDVVDHIDHVVELVGIDHVGIGSDYDGVGDSLPTGLKDVASYPNLIAELLHRGYSEEDVEKICSGNLMRVWEQVDAVAAE